MLWLQMEKRLLKGYIAQEYFIVQNNSVHSLNTKEFVTWPSGTRRRLDM